MKLFAFIAKRLYRKHVPADVRAMLDAVQALGQPAEPPFPPELVPVLMREGARGVLNAQFFQTNLDWVRPYWAVRQYDPDDPAFIPRISPIGLNQTHRNWTAIGNPGGTIEPVVDPVGLVTPWFGGWSLDTWLTWGGKTFSPPKHAKAVRKPSAPLRRSRPFLKPRSFFCNSNLSLAISAAVRPCFIARAFRTSGPSPPTRRCGFLYAPITPKASR
ncbi:MAG: hypothetical protein M5R36_20635 [Deltaproteobacteria bacterium]|nr:hypothetical protein [Deltaproteobacteria bacterium]